MIKELTTDFVEITNAKPFTISCSGGIAIEICDGATKPTPGEGISVNLGEEFYIENDVKVWARAMGATGSKATANIVNF